MLERAEPVLKILCAGLAALLLVQGVGVARRLNPLKRATVPEPPTWTPPATATHPEPVLMPVSGPASRGGGPGPALAPEVEARIDRVTQSEVLGPAIRPPPMALLGIAGRDVIFRAPDGQSGLVRAGGELGGVKILRVGTNRILVQEGAEVKELMIFEGIGGESLLPKGKEGSP